MASVLEGFLAVADAVGQIAASGKMAAATLKEATAEAKNFSSAMASMSTGSKGGAMGASSSRDTSGTQNGIQNTSPSGSLTIATGDLGDPRNAEEQMARMIASIEAAKRR